MLGTDKDIGEGKMRPTAGDRIDNAAESQALIVSIYRLLF